MATVNNPTTDPYTAVARRDTLIPRQRRRADGHYRPLIDGHSAEGRRIKSLVKLYSERLGAIDAIKAIDIQRLAECEVLCGALRAQALRLEGTTKRLRASLGLYSPIQKRRPTLRELGL
jgi:hypothetical protein